VAVLSEEEKDRLAGHLSYGARAGGAFLVGMGLLTGGMEALLVYRHGFSPEAGAFSLLVALFLVPGGLLVTQRGRIRKRLGEELSAGSGEVLAVEQQTTGEGGPIFATKLSVTAPDGRRSEAWFHSYQQPTWAPGEALALIFLRDGRYFPRALSINANPARLTDDAAGRSRIRRRARLVFALLALSALFVGMLTALQ
jgi:hypothetical protein